MIILNKNFYIEVSKGKSYLKCAKHDEVACWRKKCKVPQYILDKANFLTNSHCVTKLNKLNSFATALLKHYNELEIERLSLLKTPVVSNITAPGSVGAFSRGKATKNHPTQK